MPPFLQTAIISSAYGIYLPRPPVVMQKVLFALLVPVGRFMGFRASYPCYSGEDAPEADSDGRRLARTLAVICAGILAVVLIRRRASRR